MKIEAPCFRSGIWASAKNPPGGMRNLIRASAGQQTAYSPHERRRVRAHHRRRDPEPCPPGDEPTADRRTEHADAGVAVRLPRAAARGGAILPAPVGILPVLDTPTSPAGPIALLLVSPAAIAETRERVPDDAPDLPHESGSRNDARSRGYGRVYGVDRLPMARASLGSRPEPNEAADYIDSSRLGIPINPSPTRRSPL